MPVGIEDKTREEENRDADEVRMRRPAPKTSNSIYLNFLQSLDSSFFLSDWRCPVYDAVRDPHLDCDFITNKVVLWSRSYYGGIRGGGWRSGTLGWRTLVRRGEKTSIAGRRFRKSFWQFRGWRGLGRNASQISASSLQCTEADSIEARGRGRGKAYFDPEPQAPPASPRPISPREQHRVHFPCHLPFNFWFRIRFLK